MARGDLPPAVAGIVTWTETHGVALLAAVLALLAGWYVGKVLVRVLGRRIARRFQRPSVTRIVIRMIRLGALLMGAFVALTALGLRIGDIALSVTVFSAVLGIVLAPIVGSVVNGLFVLADQPYEIGDLIGFADSGRRGFVEDITLRYTKVFTLNNTFLVISNASIRERDIINYSAEDERTRLSLDLQVTYEGDLEAARRIMASAAGQVPEVVDGGPDIRIGSARYPAAPTCYINEYSDHGVLLTLRYWAREPYRQLTVRSKVQENVWEALAETDDVSIAYPHSHLVFDETSGEARVAVRDADGRRARRAGGDPDERPDNPRSGEPGEGTWRGRREPPSQQ